jgi:predicted glycosyltransferase
LLKDSTGSYRHAELSFEGALKQRAEAFRAAVADSAPDVLVIDRHPYGVAGELRPGLDVAKQLGSAVVLGLRDILDEPAVVQAELAGDGWAGVPAIYDEIVVYGERRLCDHEVEYGLPMAPTYCGWVAEVGAARPRERDLLVVTGGGGGDGDAVFRLGAELAGLRHDLRVVLVAGPYASAHLLPILGTGATNVGRRGRRDADLTSGRLRVVRDAPGCADLFAGAGCVVQMAGYNSTFEALASGIRPILVPRRSPRREQAIRASRLAALGLADVVDETAPADEVAWLLERPRLLPEHALENAGIRLDGAERAARLVRTMLGARVQ